MFSINKKIKEFIFNSSVEEFTDEKIENFFKENRIDKKNININSIFNMFSIFNMSNSGGAGGLESEFEPYNYEEVTPIGNLFNSEITSSQLLDNVTSKSNIAIIQKSDKGAFLL